MAQASFDVILATRRLQDAGFGAEQAEAVVQTVTQANSLNLQMVQDLADLKAHATENMVTKSDLKELVTQLRYEETLETLATREDCERAFAQLNRYLLYCGLGLASLIIAAIKFL